MIGLGEGDDPAELERLVERAKAQWAVSRIRKRAHEAGLDRLDEREIEAESEAVRASRGR